MELLATVDWLLREEGVAADTAAVRDGLARWPGGDREAAERKRRIFDDRLVELAPGRLREAERGDAIRRS